MSDMKETIREALQIYEESMDQEDREIRAVRIELYKLELRAAMYEHQLTEVLEPHSWRWNEAWEALVEVKKQQEALSAYLEALTTEAPGADPDQEERRPS